MESLAASQGSWILRDQRRGHARDPRDGRDLPGKLPGNEAESGILQMRIENLGDSAIRSDRAIESEANRI